MAGGIVAAVLLVSIPIGYRYGITLWDWIRVLALPITVGAAVPLLNKLQKDRELAIEDERKDHQLAIEDERKARELTIQDQYAQDASLQAYLDQMSQLMLLDPTEQTRYEVQILAKARTFTVLRRLGPVGKRSVLDFLYEANMIQQPPFSIQLGSPDYSYSAADLSGADLRSAFLKGVDLSGPHTGANLSGADLRNADLEQANLSNVTLKDANLREANLIGTTISGVDLSGADTSDAKGVIAELLRAQASSLEGATMPNGQKYEEWLKGKEGRTEDGKNGSSS